MKCESYIKMACKLLSRVHGDFGHQALVQTTGEYALNCVMKMCRGSLSMKE